MIKGTATAACLGKPDLFDSRAAADHRRARAYCSGCPITADCLDEALAVARQGPYAVPDGTWGGLHWLDGHITTHSQPTRGDSR